MSVLGFGNVVFWCGLMSFVASRVYVCESVGCEVNGIYFSLVLAEMSLLGFLLLLGSLFLRPQVVAMILDT